MLKTLKMSVIFVTVFVFLASVVADLGVIPSYAAGRDCSKGTLDVNNLAEELSLSEEQTGNISAIKEDLKASKKELYGTLRGLRATLREELLRPDTDTASVENIVDRINSVRARITEERVESFLSMKKILTAEQFRKMIELKKNCNKDRLRKDQSGSEESMKKARS